MLRKSLDNVPLPGKVLHELARKFDGVPFNAADARDGDLGLIREEMVEAVAEFVEERRHVVMRERGGAAVDALGKVADEIGDRRLQDAVHDAARAVGVHPGAGALAFSRIEVGVEGCDDLVVATDFKVLDVGVPDAGRGGTDADAVERFRKLEES